MTNSRKILIAALVVVVLPLLTLAALPLLLNGERFRPTLQSQMERRLHRPVTVGAIQVKTFPLALYISELLVGQPAGTVSKPPFVEAKEVFVAVDLWPLLRKEVVINAVRLKSPRIELVRNPAAVKKNVKLLWLGCGNKDGLLELSEELDAYLKAKDVPHVFHVDGYGHNRIEWSNNLYFFAQRLFR